MLTDCPVTVRPMPRSLTAAAITRTDASPRPTHFFLVIFISQCGVNGDCHSVISVFGYSNGPRYTTKTLHVRPDLLSQLLQAAEAVRRRSHGFVEMTYPATPVHASNQVGRALVSVTPLSSAAVRRRRPASGRSDRRTARCRLLAPRSSDSWSDSSRSSMGCWMRSSRCCWPAAAPVWRSLLCPAHRGRGAWALLRP